MVDVQCPHCHAIIGDDDLEKHLQDDYYSYIKVTRILEIKEKGEIIEQCFENDTEADGVQYYLTENLQRLKKES